MGGVLQWHEGYYWANLRRSNGQEEPYNVKYWALGNECYGEWQVAQSTKEDYAKKGVLVGESTKATGSKHQPDPLRRARLCRMYPPPSPPPLLRADNPGDRHVLGEYIKWIDMHSIHAYTADKEFVPSLSPLRLLTPPATSPTPPVPSQPNAQSGSAPP